MRVPLRVPRPMTNIPRLELRNITKSYPSVVANDHVSLSVMPGEIHAVLGENGAGKSTLMKIIYGVTQADEGAIYWNGNPVIISSPAAARRLGIGMVFQHFSLFETLTVAENIALAVEGPFDLAALGRRIDTVSARYGLALDADSLV
ncbi:MAG: ATP-binding cassette domain-containing protein, partial [Lysobacterales bacterium]